MYVEDENRVREIVESFKNPLNLAEFFAEKIQRDFEELGYSIDWRRKFHTGEPIYNQFVTWQFYKLLEKGLITRGDHTVTYCLLHQQPEGEDDIQDADVNPVEILEFTAVKFKLVDTGENLLAATLRPETLFGATNIWVNPDADYVVFKWNDENYIVSKEALVKLEYVYGSEHEITVLREFKGRELVGKRAVSPLGEELLVLPAWFVDPDNATGIVYSEPSDAPYDYVALQELKRNPELLRSFGLDPEVIKTIEPRKIIRVPGLDDHHAKIAVENAGIVSQHDPRLDEITAEVYREQFYNGIMIVDHPEFRGLTVREARDKMKKMLYENNMALPFFELNRKARCRAGGRIVVAKIKNQWFINYNVDWLKKIAWEWLINDHVKITPAKYKKLFLDTLNWLDKRPCARKRGIGTRLPWDQEWIIESLSDSTVYMAFYTIVHIIRENNIKPEQLTPEVFDYVFLGLGDPVDVSTKSGIPLDILEKMRKEFTYWYPVDQRHTAIPHISNHLSFYILHHAAIFPPEYMPRLISLNETVIREGAKMSKSKGNVIPLRHITTMYSADLFRLYISWAASLDSVLDWREAEVGRVLDSMLKFVNTAKVAVESSCTEREDVFTEWFINKFYETVAKATSALENMEIREYVQSAFFDMLALVDKYRSIVGDDYVCGVKKVLSDWLILLNPVIPHLTEEINSWMNPRKLLSLSTWPEIKPLNKELVVLVDNIDNVLEDARELIELLKKKPSIIYLIVAPEWKREIARLVLQGKSIRDVIEYVRARFNLRGREHEVVEAYNAYKKSDKEWLDKVTLTTSKGEFNVYTSAQGYFESKLGAKVVVVWEDEARVKGIPKAERAMPLKPAIYIE
jgi:leucyl-tRNA synthetase